MAIKQKHKIIITLRAGLSNVNDQYKDVLSQSDLEHLQEVSTQKFYVSEAYHRVEQMHVTKERIDFTLAIYNANASNIIETKRYSFTPDTNADALNYHTQCYDYVKSLDEYKNSVDC